MENKTPIEIHYDKHNRRAVKVFTDHRESKRFYITKYLNGKNPKVVNPAKREKEAS